MSSPATGDHQSPLEAALHDVHATLAELLVAADEQHAAVTERDRNRLEGVTQRQERLAARLERVERKRIALQREVPLETLSPQAAARVTALSAEIADSVRQLQERNALATTVLERSIELASQTLNFLQRLVTAQAPAYGAHGATSSQRSVLVDSRA
jgi:flagellar biosynthesis/type III secretory pathway chaperone